MKVHTSQWALDSFSEDRPSQLRMVLEVRYSGSQRSRLDLAQEGLGQANLWGSRLLWRSRNRNLGSFRNIRVSSPYLLYVATTHSSSRQFHFEHLGCDCLDNHTWQPFVSPQVVFHIHLISRLKCPVFRFSIMPVLLLLLLLFDSLSSVRFQQV